jgi:hypothetical protein
MFLLSSRLRCFTLISGFVLFVSPMSHAEGQTNSLQGLSPQAQTDFVVNELRRCPSWILFGKDEKDSRNGILQICEGLNQLNTESLNQGIEKYWSLACTLGAENHDPELLKENWAKIFLLIRVLFEVPTRVPYNSEMSLGPFYDREYDRDSRRGYRLIWPLENGPDGTLLLTGVADSGVGFGPPYEGLRDLKFIETRFQRRHK